jgi:hypothetical protein
MFIQNQWYVAERKTFAIKIDAGGIHARRVIAQLIEAEKEGCNDFLVKN